MAMSQAGSWIVAVVIAHSLASVLTISDTSYAQRIRTPGGTGGGPGHLPSPPIGAPSRTAPTLSPTLPDLPPTPKIETPKNPRGAVQTPPVPVVRFRCELAPNSYECTKPASEDSGGEEEKCGCARDRCRVDRIGNRVCEKLR